MENPSTSPAASASIGSGRLLIGLAAVMWSLSGAFTRILSDDTPLRLGQQPVVETTIAFYRVLFAGLVLVPMLRRRDLSFRPIMLLMVGCFAVMNISFVSAMAWGKSGNVILLQYTGPMWMYLASFCLLGEPADRRGLIALLIGVLGIGIIVWGGTQETQWRVVGVALASGLCYGGVIVCLRVLRQASPRWLTVINHLGSALALVPVLWVIAPPAPTLSQLGVLFLFGAVQMAIPYWLMARGLQTVSPQEAGTITLLEPLLNPLWAYLVAPEKEKLQLYTVVGGACIIGALAWRYWPRKVGSDEGSAHSPNTSSIE